MKSKWMLLSFFFAMLARGGFASDYVPSASDSMLRKQIERGLARPGLLSTYGSFAMTTTCNVLGRCLPASAKNSVDLLLSEAIKRATSMSFVRPYLQGALFSSDNKAFAQYDRILRPCLRIPGAGISYETLSSLLEAAKAEKIDWQTGSLPGAVYDGSDKHMAQLAQYYEQAIDSDDLNSGIFKDNYFAKKLAVTAFKYFQTSNPMHGRSFPLATKAMRELGAMLASLVSKEHAIVNSGAKEALRLGLRGLKHSLPKRDNRRVKVMAIDDDADLIQEIGRTLNLEIVKASTNNGAGNYLFTHGPDANFNFLVFYLANSNLDKLDRVLTYANARGLHIHIHVSRSAFRQLVQGNAPELQRVFARSLWVSSVSFDTDRLIYNGVSATVFLDASSRQRALEPRIDWAGGIYPGINAAGSIAGVDHIIAYLLLLNLGGDGLADLAKKTKAPPAIVQRPFDLSPSTLAGASSRLIKAFKKGELLDVHQVLSESQNGTSAFDGRAEREKLLVELTLAIFNASTDQFFGRIDSGGTESIRLAMQVHLDRFRAKKPSVKPHALMTRLAHLAFDRHLEDNDAEIVRVDTMADQAMSTVDLEKKITEIGVDNIAVIVASAPNYP
ncbi:MAG TPA: hypothetical protein VEL47_08180, partial [Myxococcota bacterium]|nr:hypothetical protein [Myxococcota bacterium]